MSLDALLGFLGRTWGLWELGRGMLGVMVLDHSGDLLC
jgi:hypothetical protein